MISSARSMPMASAGRRSRPAYRSRCTTSNICTISVMTSCWPASCRILTGNSFLARNIFSINCRAIQPASSSGAREFWLSIMLRSFFRIRLGLNVYTVPSPKPISKGLPSFKAESGAGTGDRKADDFILIITTKNCENTCSIRKSTIN